MTETRWTPGKSHSAGDRVLYSLKFFGPVHHVPPKAIDYSEICREICPSRMQRILDHNIGPFFLSLL